MSIGTLNEAPLHAAIKAWYAGEGAPVESEAPVISEAPVGGYVIDLVRGDLLIEVQTRNFSALRRKLAALTRDYAVRLVHPIPLEKWIVRVEDDGATLLSRRKSPRRGAAVDVFAELVHIPALLADPHFSLDVLLIQEEELRRHDPRRGWRRKGWVTHERRLLAVVEQRLFETPADLASLLPPDLPDWFTTADLAAALGRPRRLAQQMAYCLRALDVIREVGKRGRAVLYESDLHERIDPE